MVAYAFKKRFDRATRRSFEIAKEAAVAEKNEDNNYEVRGIRLIEADSDDESEYQMTIESCYPAFNI